MVNKSKIHKILKKTEFGNPVLRGKIKPVSPQEIISDDIQDLIADMRHTLVKKKYGIGIAAPQVGRDIALSVIHIRPNKTRPDLPKEKWADLVIINPRIVMSHGNKKPMWEGCISLPEVFAKVPRYKKIELEYLNEYAKERTKIFEGLLAHVIQHEVDHLNGVLYVDRVKDPSTFMSGPEYRKRIVPNTKPE